MGRGLRKRKVFLFPIRFEYISLLVGLLTTTIIALTAPTPHRRAASSSMHYRSVTFVSTATAAVASCPGLGHSFVLEIAAKITVAAVVGGGATAVR